ncbi:MAG: RecQ family ATP-dependent DNA helicase [Bacteroidota bacterium]
MAHPINILERYWQHTSFRPLQEDIINAVLDGDDVFALLPTGGGKSVCFQIPALIKEGICIVVSPLIALMKDQIKTLNAKGIKAVALTSGISYKELDVLLDNCIYGNIKFLYLSPERLQQDIVQQRIEQMNVNLIAVDEAHCISQWGNDFRPAYKNITILRKLQPSLNVIALTATAQPKVVKETMEELDFISPKVFKASFKRPSISYQVRYSEDKLYDLEQILKNHTGASIVYVRSRKLSVEIQDQLEKLGLEAAYFHGGLSNTEKEQRLEDWMSNRTQVMVATTAFGMGIDKADVETVIHLNLPESLESYYQEAGRAGRNGGDSYAIVLTNNSDELLVKNQFINNLPTIDDIKFVYRKLCNYFQISYGEGEMSQHQFDFNAFCKAYDFKATKTFNILNLLDRNSIIKLSQQFNYRTKLKFTISNNALFAYLEKQNHLATLIKTILRTYGGIFENELPINLTLISKKTSMSEERIIQHLSSLAKDEIVDFQHSNTDSEVVFIQPREDDKTINRIAKLILRQQEQKRNQVFAVIDYIENDNICKSIQLLDYFGETSMMPCGKCSVCIAKNDRSIVEDFDSLKFQIIELLKQKPQNSRQIVEHLNFEKKEILKMIKLMLEHNILILTPANTYKLKNE